jgi:energy-coupling factor transporter ATP-binding protein EcfA2
MDFNNLRNHAGLVFAAPQPTVMEELGKKVAARDGEARNNGEGQENMTKKGQSAAKRTVLLIGSTGQGKSTLANTIMGHMSEKEKLTFDVGHFAGSCTKDAQIATLHSETLEVRIVDTIGIGDTKLTQREVLLKLARSMDLISDGVNQIYFVMGGRITESEIKAFQILLEVILNSEALAFTTLVRSRFKDFLRPDECAKDKESMLTQNKDAVWIIKSVSQVIWLDNDFDKPTIKDARERIMKHIQGCDAVYKPKELSLIHEHVAEHFQKIDDKEKELQRLQKSMQKDQAEMEALRGRVKNGEINLGNMLKQLEEKAKEQNKSEAALREQMEMLQERASESMKEYAEDQAKQYQKKLDDSIESLKARHSIELLEVSSRLQARMLEIQQNNRVQHVVHRKSSGSGSAAALGLLAGALLCTIQ